MKKQLLKQKNMRLGFAIALALGVVALPDLSYARRSGGGSGGSGSTTPTCTPPSTQWSYLTGYNSSNGKPNGMTSSKAAIPTDMIDRILKLLPEGKDITQNTQAKALITDDLGGNVFFTKPATIKIAFLTEGAGYSNALGFFKFDKSKLPKPCVLNEKIIFPNASASPMSLGDTVDLGSFSAGDALGFTVVANGWKNGEVNTSKPATGIFRSVLALNPETNGANAHTVLLSSPADKLLVLGFEDLNRQSSSYNDNGYGTDNDFNDVIIAIIADPFDAIDTSSVGDVDTGEVTPPTPDTPPVTPATKPVGVSGRMNWREKADTKTDGGNSQEALPR